MEKALERQLEETCRVPGMLGAICVDNSGLMLAAKGQVSKCAAGPVSSLAQDARMLHPKQYTPIVVVESAQGKILIKQEEEVITAIYKT